ncbi:MAG: hypothetical protein MZV64_63435 [Ignavibacteriales bacterium]|nr:hypothetical protein [Ignavibacteriales bacterium]
MAKSPGRPWLLLAAGRLDRHPLRRGHGRPPEVHRLRPPRLRRRLERSRRPGSAASGRDRVKVADLRGRPASSAA